MLWVQKAVAPSLNGQPSANGVLRLLQHVCTARDRHRLYVKVRRFAAAGGVAVCEHYPIRENQNLVGPRISALLPANPGRQAVVLRNIEAAYYRRMVRPDILCILKLDSDLAVRRKPDQQREHVRQDGREMGKSDWSSTGAHVIDASLPLTEVLRQMKSLLWQAL
jgi:hypothetical protein